MSIIRFNALQETLHRKPIKIIETEKRSSYLGKMSLIKMPCSSILLELRMIASWMPLFTAKN